MERIMGKLFVFLTALLAWMGGLAQASAAQPGQPLPLWEVQGTHATVYLFGSIHVCRESCYPLPETVLTRFDESAALVLELDPSNADTMGKLMEAAVLPAGQRLTDKLSAAEQQKLSDVLHYMDLPEESVVGFKPWMANAMMELALAQKHGLDAEYGVDMWLLNRAQTQNKKVIELETVERQIAAMSAGSESEQLGRLVENLDKDEIFQDENTLIALVNSWQTGDMPGLSAVLQEERQNDPAMFENLLDRRNEEMTGKIAYWLRSGYRTATDQPSMLGKQKIFIAIGVGHLVGPRNIGELLAEKGFSVRQTSVGE